MIPNRHRHRLAHRLRSDRGSVTLWLLLSSLTMIILVGLAADLGGQVRTQQHARQVAGQAARAAGQVLDAQVVAGQHANLDTSRAIAAAQTYLAASDVTGSVSISNGTTVVVSTSARYPTKVLGIIGIDTLTVTGRGEARTVRALDGGER